MSPLDLALSEGGRCGEIVSSAAGQLHSELSSRVADLEQENEANTIRLVEMTRLALEREQKIEELEGALSDRLNDTVRGGGAVVHRWYRVGKDGNRRLIEDCVGPQFTPSKADVGMIIVHEIEPVREKSSFVSGSKLPSASSGSHMGVKEVKITTPAGHAKHHTALLTCKPVFSSSSTEDERPDHGLFQWYRSDSAQATWVMIPGAVDESYQPSIDDVGLELRCSYTPVGKDGAKGVRMYGLLGAPLAIEPMVKDIVTKQITQKEISYEVFSKSMNKAVTLLVFPDRLKVREGKTTKLKHGYDESFKVELAGQDPCTFTVHFTRDVSMDFKTSTPRDRDIVCLAIRSLAVMHMKKGKK